MSDELECIMSGPTSRYGRFSLSISGKLSPRVLMAIEVNLNHLRKCLEDDDAETMAKDADIAAASMEYGPYRRIRT